MMQNEPQRMSKSEWKRQVGSGKNLKNLRKLHKQRQKMQLQQQFERTTGQSVQDWDDGKSIGKKAQVRNHV